MSAEFWWSSAFGLVLFLLGLYLGSDGRKEARVKKREAKEAKDATLVRTLGHAIENPEFRQELRNRYTVQVLEGIAWMIVTFPLAGVGIGLMIVGAQEDKGSGWRAAGGLSAAPTLLALLMLFNALARIAQAVGLHNTLSGVMKDHFEAVFSPDANKTRTQRKASIYDSWLHQQTGAQSRYLDEDLAQDHIDSEKGDRFGL